MKLGAAMGEMSKPNKGGATKEAICESDAQCSDNETCKNGNCVNVCNPSPCPSDEFCLNEGNHSYSCVECTSNEQCDDREICKNNSCVDACTGNPCASKNQACSSQSGHSYICYGCVNNNACGGNEKCSGNTCADVCSGNPCSSQGKLCQSNGSHGYSCYGCVNNNGCSNGKVCSSNQCVCPSGYEDDGNGGCKSTDPCANVSCGTNEYCSQGQCYCKSNYIRENGQCRRSCESFHLYSEKPLGRIYSFKVPVKSDDGGNNFTCWGIHSICEPQYIGRIHDSDGYANSLNSLCRNEYVTDNFGNMTLIGGAEIVLKFQGYTYFCCKPTTSHNAYHAPSFSAERVEY